MFMLFGIVGGRFHGFCVKCAILFLQGLDLVPEPRIVIAALKACRRVNDYALAVRYMEAVQVCTLLSVQ